MFLKNILYKYSIILVTPSKHFFVAKKKKYHLSQIFKVAQASLNFQEIPGHPRGLYYIYHSLSLSLSLNGSTHSIWEFLARDWVWAAVAAGATAVAMLDPLTNCARLGIKHTLLQWPELLQSDYFFFLQPHLRHLAFPRIGVEVELQLPAYPTATAIPDPSRICDLHCSLWQHSILNSLSETRGQTRILMDTMSGS